MKQLKAEIRLFIAEKFLGWAISIAPKNKEGNELTVCIGHYFAAKVQQAQKQHG